MRRKSRRFDLDIFVSRSVRGRLESRRREDDLEGRTKVAGRGVVVAFEGAEQLAVIRAGYGALGEAEELRAEAPAEGRMGRDAFDGFAGRFEGERRIRRELERAGGVFEADEVFVPAATDIVEDVETVSEYDL